MNQEEIIRDEAKLFCDRQISSGYRPKVDYQKFTPELKYELSNFYPVESKVIFLDEVKNILITRQKQHYQNCDKGKSCPFFKDFEKARFYMEQELNELDQRIKSNTINKKQETNVFICYSNKDKEWLNKLKRHFKPLACKVVFWDKSLIRAGRNRREEIEDTLKKAKIAILLLSVDFFDSDSITTKELPKLLELAEKQGTTILSLILKPYLFEEYPEINQYQAINTPSKTVIQMTEAEQEITFLNLVKEIKNIIENY